MMITFSMQAAAPTSFTRMRMSVLSLSVLVIVLVRADEQMPRIHARWIVTMMTNKQVLSDHPMM
jgi:hypothetical protein